MRSVVQVGPSRRYRTPSEVATLVADGAIVEIDAGVYSDDAAIWRARDLTLRGVGGTAHLDGRDTKGKAIWTLMGDHALVENVEFSGAHARERNGAGIRIECSGLTVRHCVFHDNENGILGGGGPTNDIVVEHSEFARNGFGDGYSHNIYIGAVRTFTLRFCYSHHARVGQNVKTRARTSYILYNRLMDEETGTASYEIDVPDGGRTYIVGNLIQQGPRAENKALVAYAAETRRWRRSRQNPVQAVYVINNTIVNEGPARGYFLRFYGDPLARVINNLFVGPGRLQMGTRAQLATNVTTNAPGFVDGSAYDYRLTPGSVAIDAGSDPGVEGGFVLAPDSHYVHPVAGEPRPRVGPLDVGAYELVERPVPTVRASGGRPDRVGPGLT